MPPQEYAIYTDQAHPNHHHNDRNYILHQMGLSLSRSVSGLGIPIETATGHKPYHSCFRLHVQRLLHGADKVTRRHGASRSDHFVIRAHPLRLRYSPLPEWSCAAVESARTKAHRPSTPPARLIAGISDFAHAPYPALSNYCLRRCDFGQSLHLLVAQRRATQGSQHRLGEGRQIAPFTWLTQLLSMLDRGAAFLHVTADMLI